MVGCWRGYLSGARCRLAYGPADATASTVKRDATVSCFSKIQIGFTFLVPAHPGSPGQRAIKRVCVNITFSECVPSCAVVTIVDVIGGLLGYISIKILFFMNFVDIVPSVF